MAKQSQIQGWTKVIDSKPKLLDLKLREVIRYKDLIGLLIKRDFTVAYKQSVLGPLWYVIQPIVSSLMYTFIFGNLASIGTEGVPYMLFYFAGSMLWNYFAGSLLAASDCFLMNKGVFDKVYFPRLCVPISTTAGALIKMLIQFACLMIFYVFYLIKGVGIHPSWYIALFPLLCLWIGTLGMGFGLVVSALTTKYRDLRHLINFALPLAMYATPVVYPLSEAVKQIPEKFQWVFMINPMSAPVEYFRVWFYGAGSVPVKMLLINLAEWFVILLLGLLLFNRNEKNFVDVI